MLGVRERDGHVAVGFRLDEPVGSRVLVQPVEGGLLVAQEGEVFLHLAIVIEYCDKLAQAIKGYQFMPSRGLNWNLPRPTLTMIQKFPQPTPPLESYQAFLDRYEYLREQ